MSRVCWGAGLLGLLLAGPLASQPKPTAKAAPTPPVTSSPAPAPKAPSPTPPKVTAAPVPAPVPKPASPPKPAPRPEPVAETRLLMDALARPNVGGLNRILKDQPKEADAWKFARGQALVVAETGNLLLLRGPKDKAALEAWQTRAAELRDAAAKLGKAAGAKDYVASRAALVEVANACNHCHTGQKVAYRVTPFAEE